MSLLRIPFFRRPTRAADGDRAADDKEEEAYRPLEWPLIRRLLTMLWPYRARYTLGVGICAIHVLLDMASPLYAGYLANFTTRFAAGKLDPMPTRSGAIGWVASVIGFWILTFIASALLQRLVILIMVEAGERVQFDVRRSIFTHLQSLSMSYYDKTKLGRIISRCTSDIGALREVSVWGINIICIATLQMVVAAAVLCWTDWRLFLSVAWLGPVLYLTNHTFRKKLGARHQVIREGWTRVSTNLAENITGMRVVTAFNRQEPNLGTFNVLQDDNTDNNVRHSRVNGLYQLILQFIGILGRLIILTYGAYLVYTGHIAGVGAIVTSFGFWDLFMNPINQLGTFFNQLMQAMASGERIFSLLDTKPEVADLPDAYPLPPVVGHVRFEDVHFGYNPNQPVLHGIEFEAKPGQMFALVGATGCGKSSIVSLIARFYQPQRGRVLVDGHDVRHVIGRTLNQQTGLVLQVNYLFSGTVMENIRYARPSAGDADILRAAKEIGSHDAIMALQDGFKTEVGERGANMSLGQRQLICFTRAYLADPRIFMLDEATSAVDTGTELQVQQSLEKLLAGRTTFVVAHRLSTIMRADQILVIDAGRIVERGTHRELIEQGGKYAQLYEQFAMQSV